MKGKLVLCILFCLLVVLSATEPVIKSETVVSRDEIYVPEDHSTIQSAIDASVNGDVINVSPDTYMENINLNGKAITLGSLLFTIQDTSYISQTIIDENQTAGYNQRIWQGKNNCNLDVASGVYLYRIE